MNKRTRVISATAFMVLGGFLMITSFVGGTDLKAGGVAEAGFDVSKFLIWSGVGALVVSAFLFISASAE
jgi:hypothetical protein